MKSTFSQYKSDAEIQQSPNGVNDRLNSEEERQVAQDPSYGAKGSDGKITVELATRDTLGGSTNLDIKDKKADDSEQIDVLESPKEEAKFKFVDEFDQKKVICGVLKEGLIASLGNICMKMTNFLVILLGAQVQRSKLIVSAIGTSTVYGRMFMDFNVGYIQGINTIIGRCYGKDDYISMNRFMWMYFISITTWMMFGILYCIAFYFIFGYMFQNDPQLLYYVRICIWIQFPMFYQNACRQTFRNFFISGKANVSSLCCEAGSVGMYLQTYWIGGMYLNVGSFTSIFASAFAFTSSVSFYAITLKYGKEHKKTREAFRAQKAKVKAEQEAAAQEQIVESPTKSEKTETVEEKDKLQKWSNFIKFNLTFGFNFEMTNGWWQFDGIITSVIFAPAEMAAQLSLQFFGRFLEFMPNAMSSTIASRLSKNMMQGKVREAKFAGFIGVLTLVIMGLIVGITGWFISDQIANILIKDEISRAYLRKNLKLFVWIVALVNLQGGFQGVLRAINKQKVFLYCQVCCNYGVHFGTMAIFLCVFDLGSIGMWYARLCGLLTANLCAVIMICKTDWYAKSEEIQKSI